MKRMITTLMVVTALSVGVVFAASVNGSYKGFPIVNVSLNGTKVPSDVPGILMNSRTLLPVRAVTEAMNSIVQWDQKTMTAKLIKPTINMIFIGDLIEEEEGHLTLKDAGSYFNTTGYDRWENLYIEIGPMDLGIYDYRIAVFDPKGSIVGTSPVESRTIGPDGLIVFLPVQNMNYSIPGNYEFRFQMKYDGTFQTVGKTVAVVKTDR